MGMATWNEVEIPQRVKQRAHSRWHRESSCWISDYSVASHGYAQIGWQNQESRHVVLAHRASWEYENGPVPVGMTLDHTCKNKRCVNPRHLRVMSNFENSRRTRGEDWPLGTCRHGHPNSELVLVNKRNKQGKPRVGLRCGVCKREAARAWAEANPEKVREAQRRYIQRKGR